MKKILLISAFLLTINLSFAQVKKTIGYLKGENPILTFDTKSAMNNLKNNLEKFSGLNVSFSDVTIKENKGEYYLIFLGENLRCTFQVVLEDGKLYAFAGISCTTTDCSSVPGACSPMSDREGSYCSPCPNEGKCTKTVSTIELF